LPFGKFSVLQLY